MKIQIFENSKRFKYADVISRSQKYFPMSNIDAILSKKTKNPKKSDDRFINHVNPFMQFKPKENQTVYWVVETNFEEELFRDRLQKFIDEHREVRVTKMETAKATKFYLNGAPESRVSSTAVFACSPTFNPGLFEDVFEGCNYFKPVFKKYQN